MRSSTRPAVFWLDRLITAALLAALLGCGSAGNLRGLPAGINLPPLPVEGSIRVTAATERTQDGSDATYSAGASVVGQNLILPSGPEGLEWGIWGFDIDEEVPASVEFTLTIGSGDSAWIAIANYLTARWEILGPYPAAGTPEFTTLGSAYKSSGDNVYILVATYNGTAATATEVKLVTDEPPPVHNLAGIVTDSVNGIPGVTIAVMPGGTTATTDSNGEYYIAELDEQEYTITPTLAGYSFTPPSRTLMLTADESSANFVGSQSADLYNVSGSVLEGIEGLEGVSVTMDPGNLNVQTDSDGGYIFHGIQPGHYVISANRSGYGIDPETREIDVVDANITGQNFQATLLTTEFSISGTVLEEGLPLSGVFLTLSPGGLFAVTDGSGNFTISDVPIGWYMLEPSATGYYFVPMDRLLQVENADVTGQDFTALPEGDTQSVSGEVELNGNSGYSGVTLTLEPGGQSTITGFSGEFILNGVNPGSYTLTPSFDGYDFEPPSYSFEITDSDRENMDFYMSVVGPKYNDDIKNMMTTHCTSCHSGGLPLGGVELHSYSKLSQHASAALSSMEDGSMPPGGGMSDAEIAEFAQWITNGKPEF